MTPSGPDPLPRDDRPERGRRDPPMPGVVRPLVDHWIVVDTGSTDGTQDLVRAALAGLPGELVARPWVDFGHNRSEALALARPHGTYTLVIDADDELLRAPGYRLPDLAADALRARHRRRGDRLPRVQLCAAPCRGATAGCCTSSSPVRRGADGLPRPDDAAATTTAPPPRPGGLPADRRDPGGALATETRPVPRRALHFYLAQSYRDGDAFPEAIAAYLRRAELGFWQEEVTVALVAAGDLMAHLGRPDDEVPGDLSPGDRGRAAPGRGGPPGQPALPPHRALRGGSPLRRAGPCPSRPRQPGCSSNPGSTPTAAGRSTRSTPTAPACTCTARRPASICWPPPRCRISERAARVAANGRLALERLPVPPAIRATRRGARRGSAASSPARACSTSTTTC